jgi:hypothetical protein
LKTFPESVHENLSTAIQPLDCVVDRICNKPALSSGQVQVFCEEFAEWIIESTPAAETDLGSIFSREQRNVVEFTNDLEFYIVRKKWIVNALHISVALATHSQNRAFINEYLNEIEGRTLLVGLAAEMETIFNFWLHREHPHAPCSPHEISSFCQTTIHRLTVHPQTVLDSVTRLKRDQVFSFIRDFHRKVVVPYLMYVRSNPNNRLQYVPYIIALADDLIAREHFVL